MGPNDWTLAVDFGTSNTVAVIKDRQDARAVQFADGNPSFPSGVYVDDDGQLISGLGAFNLRLIHPRRYFAGVKRAVTEGAPTIPLARRMFPTVDAVAAVLREAKRAAMAYRTDHPDEEPARTALTHPVGWDEDQIAVLRRAGEIAGLPSVTTYEEPVAAAFHLYHARFDVGAHIAVYDLGGGTFDTALLEHVGEAETVPGQLAPPPYRVVSTTGDPSIGGELFDDMLHDLISRSDLRDAPPWQALQPVNAPARDDERYADWLIGTRTLRQSIIDAKIDLSTRSKAAVYIPGILLPHTLERADIDGELREKLCRTVDLLSDLLRRHQLTSDQIAHVALVGGSSQIPIIRTLLVERGHFDDDIISAPAAAQTIVALGAAELAAMKPTATEAERAFEAGEAWAAHGGWKEAAACYQCAIDLRDPHWSPRAAYRLGEMRAENPEKTFFKKNYDPAIAAFRAAAEYRDTEWSARAMFSLAMLFLRLNRIEEAGVFLDNAVRANRSDVSPEAAFHLGLLHIRRGDWRSAEDAWQTAIDHRHPKWSPNAAYELGENRRLRKNHLGARDAWQVAMTQYRHPEWSPRAATELGALMREKGRKAWQLKEAEYQLAIETAYRCAIDSRHPELWPRAAFELGTLRQKRRDWKGAADAYQEAVASGDPVWGAKAVERKSGILRHL